MKTHQLKTWPQFFREVVAGTKPFEIRVGDFAVGDVLHLCEFIPCDACDATGEHSNGIDLCIQCRVNKGNYTGAAQHVSVTYVTTFGQPYGQKVLGICKLP